MNEHISDTMTTAALRDLDPAPTAVLTREERGRADATFARILATPRQGQVPEESGRPRRRRRRLLVPVGLVVAAGAGVLALPGGGSAFASWTPKPEPLSAAAGREAAATCRSALGMPDRGERVVIAERRGGWTYLLLAGPTAEGACLMPDDLVGSQHLADDRRKGFFGEYTTDPAEAPTVARDRIVETESRAGSVDTPGAWPFHHGEGWFSSVQGRVGRDVTGVTVHTPEGKDVQASVAHGRFAAWWPSDQPSSESAEVMGAWTYSVRVAPAALDGARAES